MEIIYVVYDSMEITPPTFSCSLKPGLSVNRIVYITTV